MKKAFATLVVIPVSALAISGIGLTAAEAHAHSAQEERVQHFVGGRMPGADVTEMNVRGRPYLMSRATGEVPLAYVDLAAASGASREQLIVRNLRDGSHGAITWLVWLPYPDPASKPLRRTDGSYSDQARVGDQTIRYAASFAHPTLTVTAAGGQAPRPVTLPLAKGFAVEGVSATDDGILVELSSRQ